MHFRGKLGGSSCDGFHDLQTSKKGICFIASDRSHEKYQAKVVAAIERRLGSGRTAVGHRQRPHWSVKCYINFVDNKPLLLYFKYIILSIQILHHYNSHKLS